MNLEGKRALITGGSSGIGTGLARSLLLRDARVVINGRRLDALKNAAQELQRLSPSVWGLNADVGTATGRRATLKEATNTLVAWTPGSITQKACKRDGFREPLMRNCEPSLRST